MHHEPLHHDVVVVGARAAGAATAMLLARAGLRVLVVDRGRYGSDTLSTHALMRGGVVQLHRWGLLDDVIDAGTPAIRRTTFRYAGDEIVIPVKPSHGVDALYAPRRTVLDRVLVDAAIADGADVRFGVSVTGVRRARGGRVTGITCRDGTGRGIAVEAPIVVGADGTRSAIARHVAAAVQQRGSAASAVVYGYWSGIEASGYEWIFRPNACAGIIPTNAGLACVFAAATPERIGRGGQRVLESVLQEASPDTAARVGAAQAASAVRTFNGMPGFVRQSWGPGWALVGDAGYWKDPLTAHGLTDALRDADLLARAIIASAAGELTEPAALAAYQATRDRLSLQLFAVTDVIASQRWTDADIGPLLLEASSAMAEEVDVLADLDTADV
jgi:2-polyprenyl-6-methoxyphenol hydroxylase-like FAD-dependent oxidoreductase